jgi:AcrR family transcriptional regulator
MSVEMRQGGRARQRRRTRELLLDSARALVRTGAVPTVEQAAAAAGVSPATGYRYFPSQGALVQALIEESMPVWDERPLAGDDVLARMDAAITAGLPLLLEHETLHRAALRLSLEPGTEPPMARGGRRRAITEVLAPARAQLDAPTLRRVEAALSIVLGVESLVALRDVLELDDREVEDVVRFTCRAILRTALDEPASGD